MAKLSRAHAGVGIGVNPAMSGTLSVARLVGKARPMRTSLGVSAGGYSELTRRCVRGCRVQVRPGLSGG